MIAVAVAVEAPGWTRLPEADALAEQACAAVLAAWPEAPADDVAVNLLLTDDEAVRALNRDWRGQDKPTNVLSFPCPPLPGRPRQIGDVALAFETVAREAAQEGKTLREHTAHLVVHGLLHLLGHDHGDEAEADVMERIEVVALARLGIADPYRDPDPGVLPLP